MNVQLSIEGLGAHISVKYLPVLVYCGILSSFPKPSFHACKYFAAQRNYRVNANPPLPATVRAANEQ